MPVPQATVEFELRNVEAVGDAARELEARGHTLIHGRRTEPWGQILARLLGPEGLLIGLSYAPWLHETMRVRDLQARACRRRTLEHERGAEIEGQPAADVAFEAAFRAQRGNRGPGGFAPGPPMNVSAESGQVQRKRL